MRTVRWVVMGLAVSVLAVSAWTAATAWTTPLARAAQPSAAASEPAEAMTAPAVPNDDPRVTPVVRAYQKARPAVVNIATEQIVPVRMGFGGAGGSDVFDDIFPSPFVQRVPVQSLGSGIVIHPGGYIITNAHVVRRAQKIDVIFPDKSKYPARVISAEQQFDLAVLKIDANGGAPLPFLPLGRSDDLMVGEPVIAVGNSLGFSNTLSTGVVSATGRDLEFENNVKISNLIQTDAPINPGNSGGPLLNIKGELIGITTAIKANAQNIGFAIPVDTLAKELGDLLDFERINRVIIGASVSQRHGPLGRPEVFVSAVRPDTPAAAVLRKDDQLLTLNGSAIGQIPDWACALVTAQAGDKIALTVRRGSKEVAVELTLTAKPRPDGKVLADRLLGVVLKKVTPEVAKDRHLPVDRGLLVIGIDTTGPAAEIGVKPGDVVFQVERLHVTNLDEIGTVLEDIKTDQVIRIGILRGNFAVETSIRTRKESDLPSKAATSDSGPAPKKPEAEGGAI